MRTAIVSLSLLAILSVGCKENSSSSASDRSDQTDETTKSGQVNVEADPEGSSGTDGQTALVGG